MKYQLIRYHSDDFFIKNILFENAFKEWVINNIGSFSGQTKFLKFLSPVSSIKIY